MHLLPQTYVLRRPKYVIVRKIIEINGQCSLWQPADECRWINVEIKGKKGNVGAKSGDTRNKKKEQKQ